MDEGKNAGFAEAAAAELGRGEAAASGQRGIPRAIEKQAKRPEERQTLERPDEHRAATQAPESHLRSVGGETRLRTRRPGPRASGHAGGETAGEILRAVADSRWIRDRPGAGDKAGRSRPDEPRDSSPRGPVYRGHPELHPETRGLSANLRR